MVDVIERMPTYWLSLHAPYACRHAGACCSSGWPIPIERLRVEAVSRLRNDDAWLHSRAGAAADVAGVIAVSDNGHCVFHQHGCEIHRTLGRDALPAACQHFPRQVVIDARGVFVTLSHYCPTAAELLFTHVGPVDIIEGPPAIPQGTPVGLDAREVLPPLLVAERKGVGAGRLGRARRRAPRHAILMDLDGYSAWEAHMVAVLTRHHGPAEEALTQLRADLAIVQRWRPGQRTLGREIAALDSGARNGVDLSASTRDTETVVRRFLAAHAFANWMAYQAGGVAAVLDSLTTVLAILRQLQNRLPLKEAIRQTDLRMRHAG
jgi:hypothetical protein